MRKLNMEMFAVEAPKQADALREIATYLDKNPGTMVTNLQSDYVWEGPGAEPYYEISFSVG